MAIGERIHFIRTLRGMTQKYLGMMVGFSEKTADVRMAQYETGARTPKADLTAELARVLDVSPRALDVPDIDSYDGLMHQKQRYDLPADVRYAPRLEGRGGKTGARRDQQRGIRSLALQISGV